jgi:hypothetical protein
VCAFIEVNLYWFEISLAYYRFRVNHATSCQSKVRLIREWGSLAKNVGQPDSIFAVIPGLQKNSDGHSLCAKASWDGGPYFVWSDHQDNGVTTWDVQKYSDAIGMMPFGGNGLQKDFDEWQAKNGSRERDEKQ